MPSRWYILLYSPLDQVHLLSSDFNLLISAPAAFLHPAAAIHTCSPIYSDSHSHVHTGTGPLQPILKAFDYLLSNDISRSYSRAGARARAPLLASPAILQCTCSVYNASIRLDLYHLSHHLSHSATASSPFSVLEPALLQLGWPLIRQILHQTSAAHHHVLYH